MTGSQAKELELERERGEKVGLQDSIGYAEVSHQVRVKNWERAGTTQTYEEG